ncbi:MAG: PorT family protein [Saprospirales bacterium]|nr:MAG: PorT family protein [Saprospirales bacterium]
MKSLPGTPKLLPPGDFSASNAKNMLHSRFSLKCCLFLSFLILVFTVQELKSQTFSAHITGGGNISQLRGDGSSGLKRVGLHGGAGLSVQTGRQTEVGLELLYSERGSTKNFSPFSQSENQGFLLRYADIPLYFSFKDWEYMDSEGDTHFRMRFLAGISLGRLLSSKIEGDPGGQEENFEKLLSALNSTDISWLLGAGVFFSPRWQLQIRYTRSFNPVFISDKNPDIPANDLLGSFITTRISYHF